MAVKTTLQYLYIDQQGHLQSSVKWVTARQVRLGDAQCERVLIRNPNLTPAGIINTWPIWIGLGGKLEYWLEPGDVTPWLEVAALHRVIVAREAVPFDWALGMGVILIDA